VEVWCGGAHEPSLLTNCTRLVQKPVSSLFLSRYPAERAEWSEVPGLVVDFLHIDSSMGTGGSKKAAKGRGAVPVSPAEAVSSSEPQEGPKAMGVRDEKVDRKKSLLDEASRLRNVPLRAILRDSTLLELFTTFTTSQRNVENLLFWRAVEAFKKHKYNSENGALEEILKDASEQPGRKGGKLENTKMHLAMAQSFKLPMQHVGIIMDALKIYEMFLQDSARVWVCVSPESLNKIREVLLQNPEETTQEVFDQAAQDAYQDMERDILPRFFDEIYKTKNESALKRMRFYARQNYREKVGSLKVSLSKRSSKDQKRNSRKESIPVNPPDE